MSESINTLRKPAIPADWYARLENEFSAPYFAELRTFLMNEKQQYKVYPAGNQMFAAFEHTSFDQLKVVILGQDPYHGPGQAHGLCFSVPPGIKPPPSLANIYKELEADVGCKIDKTKGDLSHWARQGVFLLNTTLTVREGEAGSHRHKGWEKFTDAVISAISQEKKGVVFLLWGKHAGEKSNLIDDSRHHILKAAHPSPLSAYAGFFGCSHFSTCNKILEASGFAPVNWVCQ